MKKLLFTFILALLATVSAWAQTFTAGNLKYEVTDAAAKTVKLTGYVTKPTGALTIPATVTNGGTTYRVTYISGGAFYECDGITSVTIPDGVTGIGQRAFKLCSALTTVTIPDGMTSIGGYAFDSCIALSSVTIPESVTSIGEYAFNSCSFTEVNIPGNITVIKEGVFRNCGKLTKISIPGKVTAIGMFAFKDCYALKEVTIGKEVKEIGANAFVNCFKLAKMTVQAIEPPIVGLSAFFNVERDIPVYVRESSNTAYNRAATWKEFNLQSWEIPSFTVDNLKYGIPQPGDESVEIIGYETNLGSRVAIPETVAYEGKSYNVTMIGYAAFMNCSALTQVIIPDKITRILNDAFFACYNLGKMAVLAKVPPKVDDGTRTFYGVEREIPVYVPAESLEAYKAADVWSWFNVVPYELPEFTADGLKYQATGISTVTLVGYETEPTGKLDIPATVSYEGSEYCVTEIGDEAFAYCENLTELVVPPTVTVIGQHAFHYNRQFTKIVVHATTPPLMRQDAFANTELSTPVYVPAESLEAYKAANRWKDFTNLQAIVVDNFTVDGLKYRIIDEENNRVEVTGYEGYVRENIPATVSYGGKDYSVTRIGNKAFAECFWVSSFTLPDGLTSIGEEAFSYCWELVEFTIPNSVETIEKAAFAYNFMQKITIGSGVKSIADEAFADNDGFAEMTVLAVVPPTVGTDAFRGTKRDIPVYVPAASLAAYQTADVWKEFTALRAIGSTGLDTPSMPESISIYGGMLHNPQQLPVIIYDLTGRLVYSGNATTVELPAGIYVVSCNGASCKAVF